MESFFKDFVFFSLFGFSIKMYFLEEPAKYFRTVNTRTVMRC